MEQCFYTEQLELNRKVRALIYKQFHTKEKCERQKKTNLFLIVSINSMTRQAIRRINCKTSQAKSV